MVLWTAPVWALEGAEADQVSRFTVAVCEDGPLQACKLRCTGVLIAPAVVLTARHCVTDRGGAGPNCASDVESPTREAGRFSVTMAPAVGDAASDARRVASISAPRATAPCGHDLAALTLAAPLEGPPVAPGFDLALSSAPPFTMVGYGATDGSGGGTGTRRKTSGAKLACLGGVDRCAAFADGSTLVPGEFLLDARACSGDSGGGAITADARVAGILSRSLESSGLACGLAVYTRLDGHALWLARAARAAPGPVPAWVEAAERRGNGPGRGIGVPCDDDADCDSALCRSKDGARSFACASPCDDSCPCVATERGGACFGPGEASGCSIAAAAPTPPGAALACLVAGLWAFVSLTRKGRIGRSGASKPKRCSP